MTSRNPPFSPSPVQVRDSIELTPIEKRIFERLVDVVNHFKLQTQLRVAGGWVRDKLLGKDCYDIDIALDGMTGREFCEKINEYMLSSGEEAQGIGVIQCNPEQSKHLETARMRLFDVWIDFVNLRCESYSESSRIPEVKFGTPAEDAYRRDLTINSLFYNIIEREVEDLTGRGKSDLRAGKIVTPLPPRQTFLDDPLRVLRAIRFGARFGFELDEELKKAAADDDVKAAIAEKISRERIGHEIDLMISGNEPVKAMAYVSELQLFWAVFSLPQQFEPPISDGCHRLCVSYIDWGWRLLQIVGYHLTEDQKRLCLYASLFAPLRNTGYKEKKNRTIPVVNYIFRNSLKLKASDAESVMSLHTAATRFVSLIPFILAKEDMQSVEVDWKPETVDAPVFAKLRILTGLLLRDIKDLWHAALVLAVLLYPTELGCTENLSSELIELDRRRETYEAIQSAVLKLGLERVWEVKPLLNGSELMAALDLKTGGPLVREWQQKCLEWQLAHPSATAQECKDWVGEALTKRARIE